MNVYKTTYSIFTALKSFSSDALNTKQRVRSFTNNYTNKHNALFFNEVKKGLINEASP